MKQTMTKEERALKLIKRQWATPMDALQKCGLFTLSQRVSEWRAAGIAIRDKWVDLPSGARCKAYRVA